MPQIVDELEVPDNFDSVDRAADCRIVVGYTEVVVGTALAAARPDMEVAATKGKVIVIFGRDMTGMACMAWWTNQCDGNIEGSPLEDLWLVMK